MTCYKIVHFIPNPRHGTRFAVGAIIEKPEGPKFVGALRQPCGICIDSSGARIVLKACIASLRRNGSIRDAQRAIGYGDGNAPEIELGEDRSVGFLDGTIENTLVQYVLPR